MSTVFRNVPRFATLLLAVFLTSGAPVAPSSAVQSDDASLEETIDAIVARAMESDFPAGLSVAVARNGKIAVAKGYGLAELEHGVPANADTSFRIGSITKQFTAAAVCLLVERFEVDLDADMHEYVPDFPTQGRVVTVRHLLTHTSGIPSYTASADWTRTVPLELSHEELLGIVAGEPFDFEPGTGYRYNNSGYYLLGVLIENVSGMSYADFVEKEFFGPLGMTRTRYDSNAALIPDRAQGYQVIDGALANDELIGLSQPGAAGALMSTARDLVTWSLALSSGKVVRAEIYDEMTTPFLLDNATETDYGFGLFLADRNDRPCVHHGGGINGFNSHMTEYPEDGLTIAVISNSEGFNAGAVEATIARALMEKRGD